LTLARRYLRASRDIMPVKFFATDAWREYKTIKIGQSIIYGMAERVGFEPLSVVENKELNGIQLPHDPPDPHESRGRDTY
jgi:hypothetical protein